MKIDLKKFGTTLISRQTGREAFAALQTNLSVARPDEIIEIDFAGVLTFSPSWGDEFLTPLINKYGEQLVLVSSENPSVLATLEMLEKTNNRKFRLK